MGQIAFFIHSKILFMHPRESSQYWTSIGATRVIFLGVKNVTKVRLLAQILGTH